MGSWFESRLRSLKKGSPASLFCSVKSSHGQRHNRHRHRIDRDPGRSHRPKGYGGPEGFSRPAASQLPLVLLRPDDFDHRHMDAGHGPAPVDRANSPRKIPDYGWASTACCRSFPLIPLALIAGSFVDRYPKRTIIVWTQVVMMLQAFALAALSWTGAIQMWQILALTFISGAATAIDVPARQAFVMEMVGDPDDLSSGIALNSAIFNLGRAIGPVLAGLLIAIVRLWRGVFGQRAIVSGRDCRTVDDAPGPIRQADQPAQDEGAPERRLALSGRAPLLLVLMSLVAVSAFLSMPFITLMPIFAGATLAESAQPVVEVTCRFVTCQQAGSRDFRAIDGRVRHRRAGGGVAGRTYGDHGRGSCSRSATCSFRPPCCCLRCRNRSGSRSWCCWAWG